jgi:hypothetical protein
LKGAKHVLDILSNGLAAGLTIALLRVRSLNSRTGPIAISGE